MDDDSFTTSKKVDGRKERKARLILMAIGALALIGLGAAGVMYGVRVKPELFGIKNEQAEAAKETEELVEEIGKMIQLPDGETPRVATVTDVEQAREQDFFRNAQNGDKVLIFANSRKIILYRPSEKKIIEVGSANIEQQESLETQPETSELTGTISVTPTPIP